MLRSYLCRSHCKWTVGIDWEIVRKWAVSSVRVFWGALVVTFGFYWFFRICYICYIIYRKHIINGKNIGKCRVGKLNQDEYVSLVSEDNR